MGAASCRQQHNESCQSPPTPRTPPPPQPKGLSWEKTKFAVGKIWWCHFWYTKFWAPDPLPNAPFEDSPGPPPPFRKKYGPLCPWTLFPKEESWPRGMGGKERPEVFCVGCLA